MRVEDSVNTHVLHKLSSGWLGCSQSRTCHMIGMGSHSALVQVSVSRKQSMKSYPAQQLLRLCSEQDVSPANLPSQALLCPESHFQITSGEANLPPIAVNYQQGKGAHLPAV